MNIPLDNISSIKHIDFAMKQNQTNLIDTQRGRTPLALEALGSLFIAHVGFLIFGGVVVAHLHKGVWYDDDVIFDDREDPEPPTAGTMFTIPEMKERKRIKKKITDAMRARMHQAVIYGKAKKRWKELTGHSVDQLRDHLESQFDSDMNWGNYGKGRGRGRGGWEIDHIVPVYMFDYQAYEDPSFKQCWQLTNLRPLWEIDHRSRRRLIPLYEICNTEPFRSAMDCENTFCEDCYFGQDKLINKRR